MWATTGVSMAIKPRAKWYVGLYNLRPGAVRAMFRGHGPIVYGHLGGNACYVVIGPFRTRAGAEYFKNHTECRSVQEAEYNAAMVGQPYPYVRPALGWE